MIVLPHFWHLCFGAELPGAELPCDGVADALPKAGTPFGEGVQTKLRVHASRVARPRFRAAEGGFGLLGVPWRKAPIRPRWRRKSSRLCNTRGPKACTRIGPRYKLGQVAISSATPSSAKLTVSSARWMTLIRAQRVSAPSAWAAHPCERCASARAASRSCEMTTTLSKWCSFPPARSAGHFRRAGGNSTRRVRGQR